MFAFVPHANGKHTRSRAPAQHCTHASQMVSTPAQVHPLSTVSLPGNSRHTSSRAPSQHCIHPAQHCINASQMVSTPGQRWEVPTSSSYCVQLLTILYQYTVIYIYIYIRACVWYRKQFLVCLPVQVATGSRGNLFQDVRKGGSFRGCCLKNEVAHSLD